MFKFKAIVIVQSIFLHILNKKNFSHLVKIILNYKNSCKPDTFKAYLLIKVFKIITLRYYIYVNIRNWLKDIEKIYKKIYILGSKVEIVALKGSKLIPQCKKCQAFRHKRKICSKYSRCVCQMCWQFVRKPKTRNENA